jgi:hypothetical protein
MGEVVQISICFLFSLFFFQIAYFAHFYKLL